MNGRLLQVVGGRVSERSSREEKVRSCPPWAARAAHPDPESGSRSARPGCSAAKRVGIAAPGAPALGARRAASARAGFGLKLESFRSPCYLVENAPSGFSPSRN